MSGVGYGLIHAFQVREIITYVCDVLGDGKNQNAILMMLETCAQETHLGQCRDRHPNKFGVGLFQIDKIAFDDVVDRTDFRNKVRILKAFGVNINDVEHCQLAYSPLLAAIFCRLFYMLIPDEFPVVLVERGRYWKRFYNTGAGAGTVDEYVANVKRLVV